MQIFSKAAGKNLFGVTGMIWQHVFLYSSMDIGTYPIDIELLVDRTPTADGTRGALDLETIQILS